jgi:hypothetical protein
MSSLYSLHRDERGQIAFSMMLSFFIFFMLCGLALDAGLWAVDHRTAQNQADAASHAAAIELVEVPSLVGTAPAAAITAAHNWLSRNGAASVSVCPQTNGHLYSGMEFWPTTAGENYDTVRVCIRRNSLVVFGALAELTGVKVSAISRAGYELTPLTYALMAMNQDGCTPSGDGLRSLNLGGSDNVQVNLLQDGSSYTRSPCDGALYIDGGNVTFNAEGSHDVIGKCAPAARCASAQVNPDPSNNFTTLIPDPFDGETQPVPSAICKTPPLGETDFQFASGTWDLPAGTYCTPLVVSSTAIVRLGGGTHIFRQGLMVAGNSPQLLSSGPVVIYMTCATGNSCQQAAVKVPPRATGCSTQATFCLEGGDSGTINVEGPTTDPGIVIWIDRTAQTNNIPMIRIAGQGAITIDGNLYAISATVEFQGQGAGQNVDITGTIIGDKITFAGRATYNVTWDADLAPKITDLAIIE